MTVASFDGFFRLLDVVFSSSDLTEPTSMTTMFVLKY